MAKVVIVGGDTGTGKSASLENLNSEETYIINVLGKDLPFKGSRKKYNRDKKNIKTEINWKNVQDIMQQAASAGYKNIVIDDARHIMEDEYIRRAGESGWGKFIDLAQQMISVINTAKSIGDDSVIVFILFHIEDVFNGQAKSGMKLKLVGRFVEEHFNPMEIVTVALFTNVTSDGKGKTNYNFVTNRTTIGGVEIPAKSPRDMFETLLIANDLNLVRQSIIKFFEGE